MSETLVTTPAPLGKKLGAWLYDALIAIAIYFLWVTFTSPLIRWLIGGNQDWLADTSWKDASVYQYYMITPWLLVLLYFVYNHVKTGQTVGMSAWKLMLVKTDGTKVSWSQATLRAIASIFGAGILSSVFNAQKRGWHDLLSGTRVVLLPDPQNK
ncbi:RDD family protein [Kangiella sp. TOML190]|uniref:RDD family protein n=1 Tax=Kangiella sp. TOML190 TaxID=2931351 RepID=UPI0020424513|nr:RDD family protein [Kangiella sp. TOML190]